MSLAQDISKAIITWKDKKTLDTSNGIPFTGKDLRLLIDALTSIAEAVDTGGGGSGIQSVTGTNVDNTDPNNPIVNLTSSNIFDSSYGDVGTAITTIDFDQAQNASEIADLNGNTLKTDGSNPSVGEQEFQAGIAFPAFSPYNASSVKIGAPTTNGGLPGSYSLDTINSIPIEINGNVYFIALVNEV